ncbi:MAG: hypothetical protein KAI24_19720 [Planctomycetes bacterium]|nr:hypothetical protein [Planctomycetota bacterium]
MGAIAPSFRSPLVGALLLTAVAAHAQAPGSAEAGKPQDAAPTYGKIVAEQARLRCWPSDVATPPVFEDVLEKDQVVRLGRAENGFQAVVLPLGPLGYVSKRFTEENEDGTVVTNGSKVAFRYRPRTSEAPVAQLPKDTRLFVVDEQDGWYLARAVGIDAWVANAEVQVVSNDPEIVEAYEAFAAEMKKAPQERLDRIAAEQKQRELDRIDLEAVQVVEAAFRKELAKPTEEQQLEGLKAALDKVEEGLQEEGEARLAAAALRKRIETQKWIVDAIKVTESKPPKADDVEQKEPPKDKLDRFQAIGWLRYETRLSEPGVYYLEKGGRRQFLLSCNTGRFDLSLFVGREIGVIGPRRSPLSDELSTLDVERLEVLGTSR